MPRGAGPWYGELNFTLVKQEKKYKALCNVCMKFLKNTTINRLKIHRNYCKGNNTEDISDNSGPTTSNITDVSCVPDNALCQWINLRQRGEPLSSEKVSSKIADVEKMEFDECDLEITVDEISSADVTENSTASFNQLQFPKPSSSTSKNYSTSPIARKSQISRQPRTVSSTKKKIQCTEVIDSTTLITEAICNFFYGCNIPFSIVESDHFKELIRVMCPYYLSKLPKSRELAEKLLDESYQRCLENFKMYENAQSVLLINRVDNEEYFGKTIVTSIQTLLGNQVFLNLWNVDLETQNELPRVFADSMELAKNKYKTHIYAVVCDDPANFAIATNDDPDDLWLIQCNCQISESLVKEVSDQDTLGLIKSILREFKLADLEDTLISAGGYPIVSLQETRWTSYIDIYENLLQNIEFMKELLNDEIICDKIEPAIKELLVNDDFIDSVRENFEFYRPIFEIFNYSRKKDATLAGVAHMWFSLKIPKSERFCEIISSFTRWRSKALNQYAIAAYFLHPAYHEELVCASNSTDGEENEIYIIFQNFLLQYLDSIELAGFSEYEAQGKIFGKLFEKKVLEPRLFWKMTLPHYRNLASLALKLMELPASSAQLEGLFTQWWSDYNFKKNNLGREKFKKLIHMYFLLEMNGIK